MLKSVNPYLHTLEKCKFFQQCDYNNQMSNTDTVKYGFQIFSQILKINVFSYTF